MRCQLIAYFLSLDSIFDDLLPLKNRSECKYLTNVYHDREISRKDFAKFVNFTTTTVLLVKASLSHKYDRLPVLALKQRNAY